MPRKDEVKAPAVTPKVSIPGAIPSWSRTEFQAKPDFIPDKNTKKSKVGSPEEQMAEAFRVVKAKNRKLEANDSMSKYKDKMDGLDSGDAIAFLEGCSDYERQVYLDAENASKQRREVLRHFGR